MDSDDKNSLKQNTKPKTFFNRENILYIVVFIMSLVALILSILHFYRCLKDRARRTGLAQTSHQKGYAPHNDNLQDTQSKVAVT